MNCFVTDMREKEIINLRDGNRLGTVCDVEFDTCSGCIVSLIIFGKGKLFGLLGRGEDMTICWDDIKVIGEDTILVDVDCPKVQQRSSQSSFFDSLFRHK